MVNLIESTQTEIKQRMDKAFAAAIELGQLPQGEIPAYTIEIPANTTHGDFACNAAMVGAKAFGMAPRQIAETLIKNMDFADSKYLTRAEIAGPGFMNFFVSEGWFPAVLEGVNQAKEMYGRTNYGKGEKVMVEFVSANPTGPMHMGNARGGAIGDCLAAVLDYSGHEVTREFYVNDAGNQIEKFAISLEARYLQKYLGEDAVEFPEDGYHGDDIKQRVVEFSDEYGDTYVNEDSATRRRVLVDYALPKNIEGLRHDLGRYRISYDEWFMESTLHNDGSVDKAVEILREKGAIYEHDGATWYRATDFGGEKDEVLIRQNGHPTYFAADIAYHYNKFVTRGFNRVIDVWGADHHGHVARLKGALNALGLDGDKLDIVLMQLVRLVKDGEPVRMSKRSGKSITLNDLLEEIPIDAARFFFNMREPSSTLDFDLGLAAEQSTQNPVYYVQYAHARICSIFKNLGAEGIVPRSTTESELLLLNKPEETELIRKLAVYPNEIIYAAKNYDPARITKYTIDLAMLFHKFYNACRIKGEADGLLQARLSLCSATRTVLKNALQMLKITTPEVM